MLAVFAEKNGMASLQIVLDNNKTHLQKMKTIFDTLAQEQNLTIQVSWIHTAGYAPKYNLAEYAIAMLRKKPSIIYQLILPLNKFAAELIASWKTKIL